jgi:hypothetical protein
MGAVFAPRRPVWHRRTRLERGDATGDAQRASGNDRATTPDVAQAGSSRSEAGRPAAASAGGRVTPAHSEGRCRASYPITGVRNACMRLIWVSE